MTAAAPIVLAPFDWSRDADLLKHWLHVPHVTRWWGPPESALSELQALEGAQMAIITEAGKPIGFLCWQLPSRAELDEAGLTELPADHVDIDIMIGEPDALGRGCGPAALACLLERLRAEGVRQVGLAVEQSNQRARAAYAKAGFRPWRDFVENGAAHLYLTRSL